MRVLRELERRLEALSQRVKVAVAEALAQPDPSRVVAGVHVAYSRFDRETARATSVKPACGPGCAFCCHVHVDATLPEILTIADFVRKTFAAEAADALRVKLREWSQKVAGLSAMERYAARIPCALLVDDQCSIHPVRPLACRAFHSLAAAPCREALGGAADAERMTNPLSLRVGQAVERGFDEALMDAGYPRNRTSSKPGC